MQLAERIEIMHRVCFDREPSPDDLALLGEPERWRVYRKMVRARFVDVIEAALPRTQNRLGDAFGEELAAWLAEGGPRLRYFRNVPDGFAAWAVPRWKSDHPVTGELAEYEIACWSVRHAEPLPGARADFSFERAPLMKPALRVLRLEHAVHQTPVSEKPERTLLCVYRDSSHRPVTWSLNPLAADLIDAWIPGDRTVAETVKSVAAAHGVTIGPAFVEKLSGMIADFLERGVLLGARAD